MAKQKTEKKYSVYDLFDREKLITLEDDDGKKVDILLVKMTQRERNVAVDVMNKLQKEEEERIKNDKLDSERIWDVLKTSTKEELLNSVLNIEEIEERNNLDKFIIPDKDILSKEEIKKKEKDNILQWKKDRREYIEKNYKEEDLKQEIFNFRIRSLAMMTALYEYNLECLVYMCRDLESKKQIFNDRDDIRKVKDKRVLDQLLKELQDFRRFETEKEVREAAQDSDFLASGGSGEN